MLREVFSRLVVTGGGLISLRPLSSCCQVQCSVDLVPPLKMLLDAGDALLEAEG